MCKFNLICLILIFTLSTIYGQTYDSYFGKGNNIGVNVSSSSNDSIYNAQNSLNGTGYFPDEAGAARFLQQATFGANYSDIQNLSIMGIENWIDNQTADFQQKNEFLSYTFYEMLMENPDVLRQKMAFALSQIFVISYKNPAVDDESEMNASYYDILYEGAFGNFRDILYDVTLHPAMGVYLSHYQNAKADLTTGTFPDENYAREVMQLFTIGLFELNNDGSHKKDGDGNSIATYSIDEIQELAKVFTGFAGGARIDGTTVLFTTGFSNVDKTVAMGMYENYHDKTPKQMIDGTTLAANQNGMDDVNYVIDMLYNHDNVGPFISYRLIQQFVKSNPTPGYVNRVAKIFNNNGNGVRGDLAAVLKAILMDTEARDCSWIDNINSGKFLQPIDRFTTLFKAFNVTTPSGKYYLKDINEFGTDLEQ